MGGGGGSKGGGVECSEMGWGDEKVRAKITSKRVVRSSASPGAIEGGGGFKVGSASVGHVPRGARGGRLQPVLMRHPPQLSVKTWGGGAGGGQWGGVGWRVCGGRGGGSAVGGGGGSQGGGPCARPTTTCIPPGGMCV